MLIKLTNTLNSIIRRVLSIVKDGLKMWLPFSKDGSDTSDNSNNATLYTGKALSFDGTGDSYYIDFGNIGVSLKTLAFWINLDSTTEKVLQLTSTQSVEVSSGTITLNGTWTGSTIYVDATATNTIAASNWKRVVITTTSAITVNDLELGRIGSSYGDFILSDFQIYDTAWTQADVTFDYENPQHLVTDRAASSIALSNLKGYWHLSEGAGGVVYDSSGEGNNGTINGATASLQQTTIPQLGLMDWAKSTPVADEITLISDPNDPSKDILDNDVRRREHSFNLDGIGYAKVDDDNTLDFGTGAFSIDGWAKYTFILSGSSTGNAIYSNGGTTTATSNNFAIATRTSGSTREVRFYINGELLTATVTSDVADGAWFYFAGTRDASGNFKLYINNLSAVSQSQTGNSGATVTTTNVRYIGRDGGVNRYYKNLVDDIRLYNRELSSDEVAQNYNAGLNQHKAGSAFSDDFSSDYGL